MNEKQAKADVAMVRSYLMHAFKNLFHIDRMTYSHAMVRIVMRTPICTIKFVARNSITDTDFHILYNTETGSTKVVFPTLRLRRIGTVKAVEEYKIERRKERNRKTVA